MSEILAVFVPTYNRPGEMLERAIRSIKGQKVNFNFELYIIDDGSDPPMSSKVDPLKFSHSYTWVYKKHGGFASAMNYGLGLTKAKYIVGLHDDDELTPESIQLRLDFMEKNPHYAMAYGNAINIRNGVEEKLVCPWYPTQIEMYEKLLSVGNFIHGGTYIIKSEALLKLGGWDERLPTKEDADLWLRVAKRYRIGYINANLYRYYIWGQNKSHLLHGTPAKEAAARLIMAKHGR